MFWTAHLTVLRSQDAGLTSALTHWKNRWRFENLFGFFMKLTVKFFNDPTWVLYLEQVENPVWGSRQACPCPCMPLLKHKLTSCIIMQDVSDNSWLGWNLPIALVLQITVSHLVIYDVLLTLKKICGLTYNNAV